MTQARPYGGVDAADRLARRRRRLLEAGLELLGVDIDPAEVTVRGICQEAGLATRYFYEGFSDKDQFIAAVFDWVIAEMAATTQAAVAAAPAERQTRAGMANIVRTIGSSVVGHQSPPSTTSPRSDGLSIVTVPVAAHSALRANRARNVG